MNTKILLLDDYFYFSANSSQRICGHAWVCVYVYTVYCYVSSIYMHNANVCQFKILWPIFLEAIASLCNKMGKAFSN